MSFLLLLWPQPELSWAAMAMLAAYLLWREARGSALWTGGAIALAMTLPVLWNLIVPTFLLVPLEWLDVEALALVTGRPVNGNILPFAEGPGKIVVLWGCTAFANASYALLLWVAITRTVRPMPKRGEWRIFAAMFATVYAINTVRLVLMSQSIAVYELVHGPVGDVWFGALLIAASAGWSLFGVRRELAR